MTLIVDDIKDANTKLKNTACCIRELNFGGHGAGNGQRVGSINGPNDTDRWFGVYPKERNYEPHNIDELFKDVKFCPDCVIWVRGCSTTKGDGGQVFLDAVARRTKCKVKGFCVDTYPIGPGVNIPLAEQRGATMTATPPGNLIRPIITGYGY